MIKALFPFFLMAPVFQVFASQDSTGLARALLNGNMDAAARYALASGRSGSLDHQLFAQFYLMTCRPRAAQIEIEQIPDIPRRALFEASLLSLISTVHPASSRKTSGRVEKGIIRYGISNAEIWRDEWAEIEMPHPPCSQMPTLADEREKNQVRRLAKQEFEKLPVEYFMLDLNIVALALDVDAEVPEVKRVLDHFADQRANPYYARLETQYRDIQIAANSNSGFDADAPLLSGIQKTDVILLPSLELRRANTSPHAIQVPILFDQSSSVMGRKPQGAIVVSAEELLGSEKTEQVIAKPKSKLFPRSVVLADRKVENYPLKVRQAIEAYRPEMLGCIAAGSGEKNKFDARITISPSGSGSAELAAASPSSTVKESASVQCVVRALSRIAYPMPNSRQNIVLRLPVSIESEPL